MTMRFVPDGKSRKETAILLVGTAEEFGVPQREVKAVNGGFQISDALAEILDKESKTKTSGVRAAKNKKSKED